MLFAGSILAQPANNDCSNAQVISISRNGFDTGVFLSKYTNLTNATVQSGEKFYNIIRTSGLDKKTVWFKVTLNTARSMRVTLQQSGNNIAISDVGFTTYFTRTGCFPDSTHADSAKLTSINKFGNSYHPCVKPGTYYIQVCSKTSVNDSIQIKIEIGNPRILSPGLNFHPSAYNFGTLSHNSDKDIIFETGCLTIDSSSETSSLPSNIRSQVTQSAWFTFTTGSKVDWFGLEYRNNNYYAPISSVFDSFLYVQLFAGDVRSSGQTGITPVGSSRKLDKLNYYYTYFRTDWRCLLQPNTTYSIKLLFPKFFDNDLYFRIRQYGQGTTLSPKPVRSSMNSASILGTLPKSQNGSQKTLTDYFSCESKLFHTDVQCGTENMPRTKSTTDADSLLQNLSTWFRFDTDEKVKLNLYAYTYPAYTVMTIYQDSVSNNCSYLDKSKILYKSNTSTYYYNMNFNCFPKGKYTVHLQAIYDTVGEPGKSFFWDYKYRNAIGERVDVVLTTYKIPQENRYSLKDSTAVYLYNGKDSLTDLPPNAYQYSAYDTMACNVTLRPEKSDSCYYYYPSSMKLNQVSYHQFRIGDYNKDNLPDSGMLTVNATYNYNSIPSPYLEFYKGSAKKLAISQNKWSYPDTLSGLKKVFGCYGIWTYNTNTYKTCATAGEYTIAIRANENHNGAIIQSNVILDTGTTKYFSRKKAANLGDISNNIGYQYYAPDRFTCLNNPENISGHAPCNSYNTKLLYRQFYINDYRIVRYLSNAGYGSYISLYKGKALDSLVPYSDNSGSWLCQYAKSNTDCDPLPPGWYTVVTYGRGPTYGDPFNYDYDLGQTNYLYIGLDTFKKPKFNRPFKANLVNKGFPLNKNWKYLAFDNGATRYAGYSKDTCFEFEQFTCLRDTAWMHKNMKNVCNSNYTKVAFYVFRTTDVTSLSITGFYEWGTTAQLYNFDVRTDSARMKTDSALQSCMVDYPNGNYKFCDMKPGWFTLVILAKDAMTGYTNTPCVRVEPSKRSTNDYALTAYDFGTVRSDSVVVNGKSGDVHPENSNYDPSAAWIYCGTSASKSDPNDFPYCWKNQLTNYKRAAARDSNRALFPYYQIGNDSIYRRNIWYTFVLNGSGKCNVTVEGVTNYRYASTVTTVTPYAIYESNATGNLNYDTLKKNGQVDSTTAQGLKLLLTNIDPNYSYCNYWVKTVQFNKNSCNDTLPKRYYVLVEDQYAYTYLNGDYHQPLYTNMYRVNIKYDGDPPGKVYYDHYSQANVINGLNKAKGPYKDSVLRAGTYSGAVGHFACATKDTSDQNSCGRKTIWYKFKVGNTGIIRVSYDLGDGIKRYYNYSTGIAEFKLFRSVVDGDSTSNGLSEVTFSTYNYNNGYWLQNCITAGTYYLMFTGCYMTNAHSAVPYIEFIEQTGDRCGLPKDVNVPSAGTYSNSVTVDCHTIGNDWGEGNSNLGCMPGPSGYKSSWFKINITDTFKYDLTFIMTENTTASASNIAYRLLAGDCSSLSTGPCNKDLLTQFTVDCMIAGSYYVQVFTPASATGTVTCQITAVKSADQTCQPTFALPVTLMEIMANPVNDDAIVEWSVFEDADNSHWDVYRSFDGIEFKKIGVVKSAGAGLNSYSFTDYKVGRNYNGEVYYKLNQRDIVESLTDNYSKTVSVTFGLKNLILIKPNPADNEISVVNKGKQVITEISVYDITGKMVYKETGINKNTISIGTREWNNGVYTIRVETKNGETLNLKQVISH